MILEKNLKKEELFKKIKKLNYAYQPIVDTLTGDVIGFEALLRDYHRIGFETIEEFFNDCYKNNTLYITDILLRDKALKGFKGLYNQNEHLKLFYNIDNRILTMKDYERGHTKKILKKRGFKKDIIAFEISEKHEFSSFIEAQSVFDTYNKQGFSTALDDFGIGFSAILMLYHTTPDYIKIDKFFTSEIQNDKKKQVLIRSMVQMAHDFNIKVIAEGIETQGALNYVKEIGCDMVQGFFIQKPVKKIEKLRFNYSI